MARDKFANPNDKEIHELHRRYVEVMEGQRLVSIGDDTKRRYIAVLTSLTDKLETPGKPLSEVLREIMAEVAPLVFETMQS